MRSKNRVARVQQSLLGSCGCLFLLALLVGPTAKGQQSRGVDITFAPSSTAIHWTLGDVLHTVRGTFKLKSGSIHLDPATGEMTGIVIVDTTSGESGNSARDELMHKKILESSSYPTITFRPTHETGKFDLTRDQTFRVDGIFNLHGQDHPLQLIVNVHPNSGSLNLTTHFDVPYVQWGLKDPSTFILRVDKDVSIEIEATAK